MSNPAPGVYTSVSASAPSTAINASTGTWFVTGETQQGPVGLAIPVTSMTDYTSFLGTRVAYGLLYDSLTEFFHDGGVVAYVSRVAGATAVAATVNITDRQTTPVPTLVATAAGPGAWGNSLKVVVSAGTISTTYVLKVKYHTVTTVAPSPNLFTPADALTWAESFEPWQIKVIFTNSGDSATPPTNLPKVGSYDLATGSTHLTSVTESTWTNALTAFATSLGPGQVSAPGHTTTTGYGALIAHAGANNRVAILDVADSSTANNLVTQAQDIQALDITTSYGALFGPWVIIPGIFSTNPGTTSPIPTRTIPPSAVVAAKMAANDVSSTNTCNTPAAGSNGQSTYALDVTQLYSDTALATLNNADVCILKPIPANGGAVTVYGYVSLSKNPNWGFLNNVRFRMQLINDFDIVGEAYVFQQIDGKGHIFARLNGALSGKLQKYYTANALYGATSTLAYVVNTGPQVNTPTTIQAGQLRAQVGVVMSPFAEFVYITVTKYLLSIGLPA